MAEHDQRRRAGGGNDDGAWLAGEPGDKASVAVSDPSEMYLVAATIARNSNAATPVAIGERTPNTPAATATPLPP